MSSKKGKGKAKPKAEKCAPLMKGLHHAVVMRNITMAVCASLVSTMAFYVFHNLRRKRIYADFHANYDGEKTFESMRSGNYFHSAPPEEEEKDDKKKKRMQQRKRRQLPPKIIEFLSCEDPTEAYRFEQHLEHDKSIDEDVESEECEEGLVLSSIYTNILDNLSLES